jgi:hypothetical protein
VTIIDALFGCWHKRKSFPLTTKRGQRRSAGTYVVCLDCGKEFAYDWQEMRIRNSRKSETYAQARVEVEV